MTSNIKIKVVLFDFGGVIAEEGFKRGLAAIAKANGLDEKKFIEAAYDTIYSTGYVLGNAPEEAYWNTLRQKMDIKGDDASLRNAIFSRFIVRDWMIDVVKSLKAGGVTVGILSDQTDMLDALDKKYDFFRFFDHVFNSYYLGKGKRDQSIFDDIVHVLGTDPERILFIDDDCGNVERAQKKGWNAIQYVDRERFLKDMKNFVPMI